MHTAESTVHSQVEETLYRQFGQQQFTVQATADSIPVSYTHLRAHET